MAITKENLVKFGYGLAEKASKTAGHISFATDTRQLFVGDGENAVAFAGNVANAVFADKKLTITYNNGTPAAVLDFSDVASAEGVSSLLGGLRKDVTANATAISNLSTAVDTSIKALDASYKAADASLAERIGALEGLVDEGGDVDDRIADAVEAEAELRAEADASIRTDFALADASIRTDFALADSSIRKDVSAYQTTNDLAVQANATAIGEVSTNLNTHATDTDIHITAQERTDWNAAKSAIDAFLDENAVSDDVVNTLKEIQEYITKDGSVAKDMLDAIDAAQDAADQAQADVDALEGVVSTLSGNFDTHLKDTTIHITSAERTAWNAAEQNAKDYADQQATAAKNAVTASGDDYIDANATNGAISISLKQSTKDSLALADSAVQDIKTGSTNGTILVDGVSVAVAGLGSAAYTETSAYEVAGAEDRAKVYAEEQATTAKNNVIGTANDNSTSITLYGVKKYAEEQATAAREAATVTGVNSTAVADVSSFVTISLKLDNKNVAVNSVNVDVQEVDSADAEHKGLAEASDVKSYVGNQIEAAALRWTVLS